MRRTTGTSLLGPLIALAVFALAAFLISFVVWSQEIDHSARVREEALVNRGVTARMAELENGIFAEINWDEAVANLDLKFDTQWARDYLTAFFAQIDSFEDVFVLKADGRAVYASKDEEDAPLANFEVYRAGVAPLVAEIRRQELARGPLKPATGKDTISQSIQESAFLRTSNGLHLVTASLVQPDFGDSLPSAQAPIVITTLPVNRGFLTLLSNRFQLDGLKVVDAYEKGDGHATFDTIDGSTLTFAWTPQKPGQALLKAAMIPVLAVLLVFSLVVGAMIWRIRRDTRQLVAANRAQNEFLANMSHELRTPLNGVIGIAGALGKTRLTAQQSEFVDVIRSSGETLEHLLSDVLDLANMETGDITLRPEPFCPAEAVRSVSALHQRRAAAKGVDLTLMVDGAAEGLCTGDAARVKQILTNLLDNAVKFTDRGAITVSLDRSPNNELRIVVQDTGVGFDQSQAKRIFRRFCQADGSITRQYGGAGLGLSIAEHLAKLMGGSIKAQGRPGIGATFTVLLPLPAVEEASAPAPVAAPEAEETPGTVRILLSDDHPTNRHVVQALLADAGVHIVATENGLEACEAYEQVGNFHVVLMDMQMPVMDGLTAIRRIRETEARTGQPRAFIIMLTANALPEHREASLAAGADLHVPKPIQAERLFAALNQAFEGGEDEAAQAA